MNTKTSFIAIIGEPNVGKSSLLNDLLGQKIAIVTPKPQTTRTKIMGVLTEGDTQLVFTDTPGYHKPKTKLGENMVKAVNESIADVDSTLFVTDSKEHVTSLEKELLSKLSKQKGGCILAVNKIDTVKDNSIIAKKIFEMTALYDFDAVVPVCALKNEYIDELLFELKKLAQPSVFYFPEDTLTDRPERALAAEMIRERILLYLNDEIPHGTAVCIEKMHEREDKEIIDIDAVIYCEKDTHKGIIIGKGGSMLKKISTGARMSMENFFGCKVNLHCWVKVKESWRNTESAIEDFGLHCD